MKKLRPLELLAVLIAGVAFLGVLHTFVIGKHFVIPTVLSHYSAGSMPGRMSSSGWWPTGTDNIDLSGEMPGREEAT